MRENEFPLLLAKVRYRSTYVLNGSMEAFVRLLVTSSRHRNSCYNNNVETNTSSHCRIPLNVPPPGVQKRKQDGVKCLTPV